MLAVISMTYNESDNKINACRGVLTILCGRISDVMRAWIYRF